MSEQSRRIDVAGVPGVPARPGAELEAFRDAVAAIYANDEQVLARLSPATIGAARRWIERHTPNPQLEAPAAEKPRQLTRNKWAKVADEILGPDAFEDSFYVEPGASSDEADLHVEVDRYQGPARRPRTSRENIARRRVLSETYRKHWQAGRNHEAAAHAAAAEIVKTYAIDVGYAEVMKFIDQMDPAERLQLLELNPKETPEKRRAAYRTRVKPKLDAYRRTGRRPRLRQVRTRR